MLLDDPGGDVRASSKMTVTSSSAVGPPDPVSAAVVAAAAAGVGAPGAVHLSSFAQPSSSAALNSASPSLLPSAHTSTMLANSPVAASGIRSFSSITAPLLQELPYVDSEAKKTATAAEGSTGASARTGPSTPLLAYSSTQQVHHTAQTKQEQQTQQQNPQSALSPHSQGTSQTQQMHPQQQRHLGSTIPPTPGSASSPAYDWPTFVAAYAAGRWNPHRTPSAPRAPATSVPTTPMPISTDGGSAFSTGTFSRSAFTNSPKKGHTSSGSSSSATATTSTMTMGMAVVDTGPNKDVQVTNSATSSPATASVSAPAPGPLELPPPRTALASEELSTSTSGSSGGARSGSGSAGSGYGAGFRWGRAGSTSESSGTSALAEETDGYVSAGQLLQQKYTNNDQHPQTKLPQTQQRERQFLQERANKEEPLQPALEPAPALTSVPSPSPPMPRPGTRRASVGESTGARTDVDTHIGVVAGGISSGATGRAWRRTSTSTTASGSSSTGPGESRSRERASMHIPLPPPSVPSGITAEPGKMGENKEPTAADFGLGESVLTRGALFSPSPPTPAGMQHMHMPGATPGSAGLLHTHSRFGMVGGTGGASLSLRLESNLRGEPAGSPALSETGSAYFTAHTHTHTPSHTPGYTYASAHTTYGPGVGGSPSSSLTNHPHGHTHHTHHVTPSTPMTPEVTAAAAAMRWAASSHVSLAPLALPSPERELTDPIRGVMVAVPKGARDMVGVEHVIDAGEAGGDEENEKENEGRREGSEGGNDGHVRRAGRAQLSSAPRRRVWEVGVGEDEEDDDDEEGDDDDDDEMTNDIDDEYKHAPGNEDGKHSSIEAVRRALSLASSDADDADEDERRTRPRRRRREKPRWRAGRRALWTIEASPLASPAHEHPPASVLNSGSGLADGQQTPPPLSALSATAAEKGAVGYVYGGTVQEQTGYGYGCGPVARSGRSSSVPAPAPALALLRAASDDAIAVDSAIEVETPQDYFGLAVKPSRARDWGEGSVPGGDDAGSGGGRGATDAERVVGERERDSIGKRPAPIPVQVQTHDPAAVHVSPPSSSSASSSKFSPTLSRTGNQSLPVSRTTRAASRSAPNTPNILGVQRREESDGGWEGVEHPEGDGTARRASLARQTSAPLPARDGSPYVEVEEDVEVGVMVDDVEEMREGEAYGSVREDEGIKASSSSERESGSVLSVESPPREKDFDTVSTTVSSQLLASPAWAPLRARVGGSATVGGTPGDSGLSGLPAFLSAAASSARLKAAASSTDSGNSGVNIGKSRPGLVRSQTMKTPSSPSAHSSSGPARVFSCREEALYYTRGYLVPPAPRDEGARRRALCKFNIVHTGRDANFERIAYLAKLVFSTRIVTVSLVDAEEEWFKMESGLGVRGLPRDEAFCAHAILQHGDEPTVVLDTKKDWRFRRHPLVLGPPNVRFFATAPLRTADGFNIGALCIMDDTPRAEFTPRQRHTLKEFAAIVMREMELWRDKIQLRIRERIQTSMEQFTRECLEIDGEDGADTGGSHHQQRAPTSPCRSSPPRPASTSERSPGDTVPRDNMEAEKRKPSPEKARVVVSATPSRSSTPALDRIQSPGHQAQPQVTEQQQRLRTLSAMERVYERAARLVKRTLDVEGAVVMDVSTFDVLETTKAEGALSIVCHHAECVPTQNVTASTTNPPPSATSTNANASNPSTAAGGGGNVGTSVGSTNISPIPPGTTPPSDHVVHTGPTTHTVSPEERPLFMEFFAKHPEGKIAEGIVPRAFRALLPTRVQHALIVPIFNIDKRPFALLCAYNTADHVKPFLEGHELSYLRAIGVIILSAVLKRRMILADKSKSLFISNISHELRTPLHGILAAAELLAETELDDNQASYLRTVQACGTSLVETVNHVLDFTKLSGNSKSGGVENVILPSKVDLMQLVEEAVEGCWIGHRARLPASSEIGSVYAPPTLAAPSVAFARTAVETVIDVGLRNRGWLLICEKGGIRRVLMNIIGNSLKFTSGGYIHIALREAQPTGETPPGYVKLELSVLDTGKGISKEFLKNQLFHPFSQENPLQSGTGLGLAIVNSIIRSESVNGQVEVSSTEGVGTEIRITFDAEVPEDEPPAEPEMFDLQGSQRPTVSLIGFDDGSKGTNLLRDVIKRYLTDWWGLRIVNETTKDSVGDILVVNEDSSPLKELIARKNTDHPVIFLSSARADPETMAQIYEYERLGGFCRLAAKPAGPSRLRQVLKAAVHLVWFRQRGSSPPSMPPSSMRQSSALIGPEAMTRRVSHESAVGAAVVGAADGRPVRPRLMPRAATFHPMVPLSPSPTPLTPPPLTAPGDAPKAEGKGSPERQQEQPGSPSDATITVGAGGTLLKSSLEHYTTPTGKVRVLVVEDNQILRDLLLKWLSTKKFEFDSAVDGREGVTAFENSFFDVVLLDLSMPVLDGIAATVEIRALEAQRQQAHEEAGGSADTAPRRVRILALTGMSSLDDKRRAFEAGVDGYLVKPVAFKTLDAMFRQLGVA